MRTFGVQESYKPKLALGQFKNGLEIVPGVPNRTQASKTGFKVRA